MSKKQSQGARALKKQQPKPKPGLQQFADRHLTLTWEKD